MTSRTTQAPAWRGRRTMVGRSLFGTLLLMVLAGEALPASADDLPGVTATGINIGNTDAYSGPAAA